MPSVKRTQSGEAHRATSRRGPPVPWAVSSQSMPVRIVSRSPTVMRSRRPPLRIQATHDARMFSVLRRVLPQRLYHGFLRRNLSEVRTWGKR